MAADDRPRSRDGPHSLRLSPESFAFRGTHSVYEWPLDDALAESGVQPRRRAWVSEDSSAGRRASERSQRLASTDARWPLGHAAPLTVPREGGLARGIHDVTLELRLRMSYIPEELQPSIWTASRKSVIVK